MQPRVCGMCPLLLARSSLKTRPSLENLATIVGMGPSSIREYAGPLAFETSAERLLDDIIELDFEKPISDDPDSPSLKSESGYESRGCFRDPSAITSILPGNERSD